MRLWTCAEACLLVDHGQGEVGELDVLLTAHAVWCADLRYGSKPSPGPSRFFLFASGCRAR